MSDVIIIIPSEFYGALYKQLGKFPHWGEWKLGEMYESLQEWLDKHCANMIHDPDNHIITGVQKVEYTSRCPYTIGHHKDHDKFCMECNIKIDNDAVAEKDAVMTAAHRAKTWEYGKLQPWWVCDTCWESRNA